MLYTLGPDNGTKLPKWGKNWGIRSAERVGVRDREASEVKEKHLPLLILYCNEDDYLSRC